jgi:DNA-binding transcriptional ArsR family regulator
MATYSRSSTAAAFQALADPTRRAVLDLLRRGALPAGQIAREFPVSRPAISKHLRLLRGARLVEERREGRHRLYRLNAEPLRGVDAWLNEYRNFWQSNLTRLKAFVETDHEKQSAHSRKKENSGLEEKNGNVADQS